MIKIRVVVSPCEVDGQHVAGDPVVEEPQQQGLTRFSGDNQDELSELWALQKTLHSSQEITWNHKHIQNTCFHVPCALRFTNLIRL